MSQPARWGAITAMTLAWLGFAWSRLRPSAPHLVVQPHDDRAAYDHQDLPAMTDSACSAAASNDSRSNHAAVEAATE